MQPSDVAAAVILGWILFAVGLSLLYITRRLFLRSKSRLRNYPYAFFQRRKKTLRRRYLLTLICSAVVAIVVGFVWQASL
jgi:hypothetical protein